MLFYKLPGIFYPFGINVAYSDDMGLFETQNFSQIAESHTPDADTAKCDAITRCFGAKNRRRHDCRP